MLAPGNRKLRAYHESGSHETPIAQCKIRLCPRHDCLHTREPATHRKTREKKRRIFHHHHHHDTPKAKTTRRGHKRTQVNMSPCCPRAVGRKETTAAGARPAARLRAMNHSNQRILMAALRTLSSAILKLETTLPLGRIFTKNLCPVSSNSATHFGQSCFYFGSLCRGWG